MWPPQILVNRPIAFSAHGIYAWTSGACEVVPNLRFLSQTPLQSIVCPLSLLGTRVKPQFRDILFLWWVNKLVWNATYAWSPAPPMSLSQQLLYLSTTVRQDKPPAAQAEKINKHKLVVIIKYAVFVTRNYRKHNKKSQYPIWPYFYEAKVDLPSYTKVIK